MALEKPGFVERLADRLGRGWTPLVLGAMEVTVLGTENGLDFPLSVPYLRRLTGHAYLDMCAFCTAGEVREGLVGLGDRGRWLQGLLMPTVDVLIPVLSCLFGLALLGALVRARPAGDPRRWLLALPVLALVLDLGENAAILALLATFPARVPALEMAEGVLSGTKFVAYGSVLVAAAVLGAERLFVAKPRSAIRLSRQLGHFR
jgi:hypothetical protein